jgi:hypothetical protein
MPFYETVHCGLGILKIEINEQYVWYWLTKHNKEKFHVEQLCFSIEGALESWDWDRPLHLDSLILCEYTKHVKRFKEEREHKICD